MICTTIRESTKKNVLRQIRKLSKMPDLIEVRIDYIKSLKIKDLKDIISSSKVPLIITNRFIKENGYFNGPEHKRIEFLKKAIEFKAGYIDVEFMSGKVEYFIGYCKKLDGNTKIICSYHNFKRTEQKEVFDIYNKIKKINPDMIKIVTYANDINDNLIIYQLLKKAKKDRKKVTAFCMGNLGASSRILCLKYGSLISYSSARAGDETASGQIDLNTMKNVYNCNKINQNTSIFGLVGNPVDKSIGIYIHNYIFKNKNKVYLNFQTDDFEAFLKNYKSIFEGLSVTMPFKEKAIGSMDLIDDAALSTGSINTIVRKGNKLLGYNTDYKGIVKAIQEITNIKGKNVLIIGTGGLAKGALYGIKKSLGNVVICGRDLNKLKAISKKEGCKYIELRKLDCLSKYNIIINTTPVGMNHSQATIVNKSLINKNMIVFDSIYNPMETKLIKNAKSLGCKVIYGYKLFLYQAIEQQRLFNNQKINKIELEKLVKKSLR